MRYSTEQNFYHFTRALQAVAAPNLPIPRPYDCPPYRWTALKREARNSFPSISKAIDDLVRTPMRKGKGILAKANG